MLSENYKLVNDVGVNALNVPLIAATLVYWAMESKR